MAFWLAFFWALAFTAFLQNQKVHSIMHKQLIPAQTPRRPIIMISDSAVSAVFLSALMQDDVKMAALGCRWLLSIQGDVRITEDGSIFPG